VEGKAEADIRDIVGWQYPGAGVEADILGMVGMAVPWWGN
jgi:hypothetical protein